MHVSKPGLQIIPNAQNRIEIGHSTSECNNFEEKNGIKNITATAIKIRKKGQKIRENKQELFVLLKMMSILI